MKGKIIGIIAIIIVITLVAVGFSYFSYTGEEPYWETATEFGDWGQEIVLTYEDGTEQTLKILYDNPTLSVWHSGKEVTWISYRLNGKATGTGYSSITYKLVNYQFRIQTKMGSSVVNSVDQTMSHTSGSKPVDGSWNLIFDYPRTVGTYFPSSLSPGMYTLIFSSIGGNIQYSADGESYQTVSSPPPLTITMEVKTDKTLSVVISAGYTA